MSNFTLFGMEQVAAIAENSPAVLEAYLAWRVAWAVAEAEEAEGEEVEDGWDEMQAEREAEDGTQGETRLAGRLAQSCAAHALPLLAQLLEATVAAANDPTGGITMGHLPAALDVSRFGLAAEEARAARQEQLCSVVEVVAATLTGRPRLTGQLGQGGRPTVPAELASAASGAVGVAPLLGLVDGLITIAEAVIVSTDKSLLTLLPLTCANERAPAWLCGHRMETSICINYVPLVICRGARLHPHTPLRSCSKPFAPCVTLTVEWFQAPQRAMDFHRHCWKNWRRQHTRRRRLERQHGLSVALVWHSAALEA